MHGACVGRFDLRGYEFHLRIHSRLIIADSRRFYAKILHSGHGAADTELSRPIDRGRSTFFVAATDVRCDVNKLEARLSFAFASAREAADSFIDFS
jgi:hypothetical protein